MNNSHIATAVALRDLNCFTLETINDRILLQKKGVFGTGYWFALGVWI